MAQRLTTFSKLLITFLIIAALFFGARLLLPKLATQGSGTTATEQVGGKSGGSSASKAGSDKSGTEEAKKPSSNAASPSKTFNYTPAKPVGGKLRGVVELGAAGFNSFVVRMDRDKNWELEKAEWGSSLVYDGLASGQDVQQGLKKYISGILDYGVSGKDIHFVVSSGALKAPETQPIVNGLKKMGYVVNEVTPAQEGEYALKSALPKTFYGSAFVVDIGSGNTKVSWMDGGKAKAYETYGAKYYVDGESDSKVRAAAKAVAAKIPSSHTGKCFIIGGVPFTLAKQTRKGEERYTVLNDPGSYEADGAKTKSGLNIYQAIKDGTGCDTYVFDWDANFTIGFLLDLPY